MAIFGRSFPFPQTRVHKLVGPATTVRATIVRPVRLPDRTSPFPHVTIRTLVGPATTVKPKYVRARLPDRPRPKLGAFVSKAPPGTVTISATWSSVGASNALWTGAAINAATWSSVGSGAANWTGAATGAGAWSSAGVAD